MIRALSWLILVRFDGRWRALTEVELVAAGCGRVDLHPLLLKEDDSATGRDGWWSPHLPVLILHLWFHSRLSGAVRLRRSATPLPDRVRAPGRRRAGPGPVGAAVAVSRSPARITGTTRNSTEAGLNVLAHQLGRRREHQRRRSFPFSRGSTKSVPGPERRRTASAAAGDSDQICSTGRRADRSNPTLSGTV